MIQVHPFTDTRPAARQFPMIVRDLFKADTTSVLPVFIRGISASTIDEPEVENEISTALRMHSDEIHKEIANILDAAKQEFFEDGIESSFAVSLRSVIMRNGIAAVDEIAHLIITRQTEPEVASEALRQIAHIKHPPTFRFRLRLVIASLNSLDPQVRFGAALGLASIDDPSTILYVKRAIQHEPIKEIQKVMQQVLAQLEATKDVNAIEKNKVY